jgi:hypothetical protein
MLRTQKTEIVKKASVKATVKAKATAKATAKVKATKDAKASASASASSTPKSTDTIKIIKSVKNNSNTKNINIIVKLHPDALSHMKGNPPYTDEIEEYFNLKTAMTHHINLMGVDGNVIELAHYEDVFKVWFPVRKHYYALRINYDILVMELKIRRLKNIIKYVDVFEKLGIPKKAEAAAVQILSDNGFDTFDSTLLDSPKHTPYEKLSQLVLEGANSSYGYLLATTDAGKLTAAIAKRAEKLERMLAELSQYRARSTEGRFIGAQVWLDEITELERIIKLGQSTEWQYEKKPKRVFA